MSKQEEIVGRPISEAIGGEMAEEKEVPKRLSRKDFVKGAAVGGAGVAAVSVLASCAPAATPAAGATPVPAEECPPCPTPAAAGEAGPVTLEVPDPSGASEVTELFATRLDTLEGKTICEISNAGWEGDRTFPVIRELLQEMYPTAKFIPYTELVWTRPQCEDLGYVLEKVQAAGCDAVIAGTAG